LLLISDLHLDESRPDISQALVNFLRNQAPASSRLYILGDLFEVWIGDDAASPLAGQLAAELRALHEKGVEVFLMHGNRDFLIGPVYAARCQATLVEEPLLLTVADRRIALLHGDILCTEDSAYQQFRQLVRDPAWQADFLARPVAERQQFARQARARSRQATAGYSDAIMDVTDAAVSDLLRELDVDTLIHGHTHRPAVHEVSVTTGDGERRCQRVVLGDWDSFGWYGEISEQGEVSLHRFQLTS
jgi:UDP-2,3-diacylglucosamine hydrolase